MAALVAAFVVPGSAHGAAFSRAERAARAHCDQQHPLSCIHRAALHYHVDYQTMKYIAHRESRYDPYAKNPDSTASGLFQFLNTTWASTPMSRRHSVFSAKWNALGAGWYMHRYGYGAWACC